MAKTRIMAKVVKKKKNPEDPPESTGQNIEHISVFMEEFKPVVRVSIMFEEEETNIFSKLKQSKVNVIKAWSIKFLLMDSKPRLFECCNMEVDGGLFVSVSVTEYLETVREVKGRLVLTIGNDSDSPLLYSVVFPVGKHMFRRESMLKGLQTWAARVAEKLKSFEFAFDLTTHLVVSRLTRIMATIVQMSLEKGKRKEEKAAAKRKKPNPLLQTERCAQETQTSLTLTAEAGKKRKRSTELLFPEEIS